MRSYFFAMISILSFLRSESTVYYTEPTVLQVDDVLFTDDPPQGPASRDDTQDRPGS